MNSKRYTAPVNLRDVHVTDAFWSAVMETVRTSVIPYQWEALNDRIPDAAPSHCMANFKTAARITATGRKEPGDAFYGEVFQDSDFSKWIEAVAYSLVQHPDPALEAEADGAIDIVCAAQQDDGYLDTYYIINGLENRFTRLRGHHELYCLGHMVEGAVAYYEATGKDKLLRAVIRFVDCVDRHIGPEAGKLHGYPGHEELELALVRLYAVTRDKKHLALARYFIDQRGRQPLYFVEEAEKHNNPFHWTDSYFQYQYYQAGKPVRDQRVAEGHAVRAAYLYAGMTDIARLTGDEALFQVCKALFDNITQKQMYITGSIGQQAYGEAFTFDYDLPNDTIYGETCAAIGLVFFARRLLEAGPEGRVADVMEKALFNGIISGMSLDGRSFFYVNPLEVLPRACREDKQRQHVKPERQKWFGCACCPPNVARLVSSLGAYAYSANETELYMHLFLGADVHQTFGGQDVRLRVESHYPWEETVHITVLAAEDAPFALKIRQPGWCDDMALSLNGQPVFAPVENGYAALDRLWRAGDSVTVTLPMPVKVLRANPKVRQNIGKVAVMRGPVVYCLEQADNGPDLHLLRVGKDPVFTPSYQADLLGGVVTLTSRGTALCADWDESDLYSTRAYTEQPRSLTWVPYYAWANRGPGEMMVWVHE